MKDNYLTLKDSKGVKHDYRVLFDIEDTTNKKNYVIYTSDEKNEDGSIKTYASTYVLSEKGNMTKLKPVEMKEEFDFIEKILDSLEERSNEESI